MHVQVSFLVVLLSCSVGLAQVGSQTTQETGTIDAWIGTGRSPEGPQGIYHSRLDTRFGTTTKPELLIELKGAGFLAMHPNSGVLYSLCTTDKNKRSVAAYKIEKQDEKTSLALLNVVKIGSPGAAHLAVDATGTMLVTAQYGGASVAAFSLQPDGSVGERTALLAHEGASKVNPRRQKKPHPHWAGFSPDNRFLCVPDLGMDRVVIYRADTAAAQLTPHGYGVTPPGSGPRHMKFHKNGKWAYVVNELDLSVTLFAYDSAAGKLQPKQTILTVSKEALAKEKSASASEIRIHPNGRFVYAANRGHDTITVFRIDPETGELSVVEREPIRGSIPRNFNLDPSGRWLLAGGQRSHTLSTFEVDQETGELKYIVCISTPAPTCILFAHE